MKNNNILNIAVSYKCNLHCSYCNITKNNVNYLQKQHSDTLEDLKSGKFINNIINYPDNQLNLNDINIIGMHGYEPTQSFIEFSDGLEHWFEALPNLNRIQITTNGVDNAKQIIYLINKLQGLISKKFYIDLTISYDGEYSTSKYRGVDKNDIIKTIKEINQYMFGVSNIIVNISFRSTLTSDLIHYLLDNNQVQSYYDELSQFVNIFKAMANLNIDHVPLIALEQPWKASKDEGLLLYNFISYPTENTAEILRKHFHGQLGNNNINNLVYQHTGAPVDCRNTTFETSTAKKFSIIKNQTRFKIKIAPLLKDCFDEQYRLASIYNQLKLMSTINQIDILPDKIDELIAASRIISNVYNYSMNYINSGSGSIQVSDIIRLYCNGYLKFAQKIIGWHNKNEIIPKIR